MLHFKRIVCLICCLFVSVGYSNTASLTIGTLAYNPPFELLINSKKNIFIGFEIALMQEICLRIKTKCIFTHARFEQMPTLINSGQIDLAIGSVIITPARSKEFLFSIPYKLSHLQYMTLANARYKTINDLRGTTIGMYNTSPSISLVNKQFQQHIHTKAYNNSLDMLYALNNNKVSAILTNYSQAAFWTSNNPNFKLLGPKYRVGEGYGIYTRLGRNNLIERINNALLSIENDGTYLKLYNFSFGQHDMDIR